MQLLSRFLFFRKGKLWIKPWKSVGHGITRLWPKPLGAEEEGLRELRPSWASQHGSCCKINIETAKEKYAKIKNKEWEAAGEGGEKGRVGGSYINLNLDLKSSFKGQFKKKVNYVTGSIKLHDTHYVLWKGIYYREPVLNGSERAPRMNRLRCGASSARLKRADSVPSTPPTLPGKERQFTSNEDNTVTLPLSGAAYESREKHLWFWI